MQKQLTIVIALVCNDKGELLIAKRRDLDIPEADGKWEFLGGKIEFGEDPERAIVREVEEESGLIVQVVRLLPKILTNQWENKSGDTIQVLILSYETKVIGGLLHTKDFDHKISELKFIALSELSNFSLMKSCTEIANLLNTY